MHVCFNIKGLRKYKDVSAGINASNKTVSGFNPQCLSNWKKISLLLGKIYKKNVWENEFYVKNFLSSCLRIVLHFLKVKIWKISFIFIFNAGKCLACIISKMKWQIKYYILLFSVKSCLISSSRFWRSAVRLYIFINLFTLYTILLGKGHNNNSTVLCLLFWEPLFIALTIKIGYK